MFIQLSCVVVDAGESGRREMSQFLTGHGVHVLAQAASIKELEGILARPERPQFVVMNLDPDPSQNLRQITPVIRQNPGVSFFVLSQVVDSNLLMDAMQVGVAQFIPLPIVEDRFLAGIERVASQLGLGKRARIIHLIPSVGGCGATTVACNIAGCLAKSGKTLLMDMDLVRGTVASAFDMHPRYTISDLMDLNERLDRQMLDNALSMHEPTGLAVLPRPDLPEEADRVTTPGMTRLLNVLSRAFDYVVIDSLMSIDPIYSMAIQMADLNVIVMQLTVPSARNAERYANALRRMGVGTDKIKVVVNRFVKKGGGIEPEQVERTLGLKVDWLVPNDFKNAMGATNYGQPVILRSPRAEISTSLSGLAKVLNGKPA